MLHQVISSLISNQLLIDIRSNLRKSSFGSKLLQRVANLVNTDYEEQFKEKTISCIQAGDVVWDVGANVGLYSTFHFHEVHLKLFNSLLEKGFGRIKRCNQA